MARPSFECKLETFDPLEIQTRADILRELSQIQNDVLDPCAWGIRSN